MRIVFTDVSWKLSGGIAKYVHHTLGVLGREHAVAFFCPYEDRPDDCSEIYLSDESELAEFKPDIIQNNGFIDFELLKRMKQVAPVVEFVHIYNECADGGRYLFKQEKVCTRRPGVSCWTSIVSRNCISSNRPSNWWKFWKRAKKYSSWLKECDLVLTNSEYTREKLLFSGAEVHAVPLSLTDEACKGVTPMPEGCVRFMFVGRPVAMKGLHHMFEAALDMKGEFEIYIKVVDENAYVTELLNKYKDKVKIVLQETLDYSQAHVVVLPSLFPEPFGLVGWEAFNFSRPVIAYRSGGVPEWHKGGEVGHLVEAGNKQALAEAMQHYLNYPDQLTKQGEAAFSHVQQNGAPEKHADLLIEKYSQLLKKIS